MMLRQLGMLVLIAAGFIATWAGPAQAAGFGTFFAALNANGAVVTSSGVEFAGKMTVGKVDIAFNRDITGCAALVSINGTAAGYGTTKKKTGTTDVLQVTTFNKSGVLADLPLTVFVLCNN